MTADPGGQRSPRGPHIVHCVATLKHTPQRTVGCCSFLPFTQKIETFKCYPEVNELFISTHNKLEEGTMLITANVILLGIHFIGSFALKYNDSWASKDAEDDFLNAPESIEEINQNQSREPRWIHSGFIQNSSYIMSSIFRKISRRH